MGGWSRDFARRPNRPRGRIDGGVRCPARRVFEILTREVEIRCLPLGIPDRIPVDISALQIGDTVHLADIEIPEGTEALAASDLALAHVAIPRVVEEEEKPAEEAEEAAPLEGEAADEAAAKTEEKAGE